MLKIDIKNKDDLEYFLIGLPINEKRKIMKKYKEIRLATKNDGYEGFNEILANGYWYDIKDVNKILVVRKLNEANNYSEEIMGKNLFGNLQIKRSYTVSSKFKEDANGKIEICKEGYYNKETIDWFDSNFRSNARLYLNDKISNIKPEDIGIKLETVEKIVKRTTGKEPENLLLTNSEKVEEMVIPFLKDLTNNGEMPFNFYEALEYPYIMLSDTMREVSNLFAQCEDYVNWKYDFAYYTESTDNPTYVSRHNKGSVSKLNKDRSRKAYEKLVELEIIKDNKCLVKPQLLKPQYKISGGFNEYVNKMYTEKPELFTYFNSSRDFEPIDIGAMAKKFGFINNPNAGNIFSKDNLTKGFKITVKAVGFMKETLLSSNDCKEEHKKLLSREKIADSDVVKLFIRFFTESSYENGSLVIFGTQVISIDGSGNKRFNFVAIFKIVIKLLCENKFKIVKKLLSQPSILNKINKKLTKIVGGKKKFGIRKLLAKILVPVITKELLTC